MEKKKKVKDWVVVIEEYISSDDCEIKRKKNGQPWCDEIDDICCKENCIGYSR